MQDSWIARSRFHKEIALHHGPALKHFVSQKCGLESEGEKSNFENMDRVELSGEAKKKEESHVELSAWDPSVPPESNHYNWTGSPVIYRPKIKTEPDHSMIDLFCGCGGVSVGFRNAGFSPVLGVDIHRPSIETYLLNHPETAAILGDIRKVDDVQFKLLNRGKKISVIVAGVPCQGFSLCNRKKNPEDDRNFLFLEFIRIAKIFKPPFLVLENVSGMRSVAGGRFVQNIAACMEELGYRVDFKMLNAADFGVPQKRERLIFIGALPGYSICWPTPTHGPGRKEYVTVHDALGDLPPLESGETSTTYKKLAKTDYQRLMREGKDQIENHEAPTHPSSTIRRIAKTKPGQPMYESFKQRIRLDPGQPSPTQVSGGIRPQFSFGHPTQPRGLSIRERCRIQSFSDNFVVTGGIVQGRVQTGNAVPPLLAEAIGKALMKSLKHEAPGKDCLPAGNRQMVFDFQKAFSMAPPKRIA